MTKYASLTDVINNDVAGRSDPPTVIGERVTQRDCAHCGQPITVAPRGRPARYCGSSCRQRAWALRHAASALGIGDPRPEIIREVVERIVVTEPSRPVSARDWVSVLDELTIQLADTTSTLATRHWDHRRLYTALAGVLTALDKATPGGLDELTGRRR